MYVPVRQYPQYQQERLGKNGFQADTDHPWNHVWSALRPWGSVTRGASWLTPARAACWQPLGAQSRRGSLGKGHKGARKKGRIRRCTPCVPLPMLKGMTDAQHAEDARRHPEAELPGGWRRLAPPQSEETAHAPLAPDPVDRPGAAGAAVGDGSGHASPHPTAIRPRQAGDHAAPACRQRRATPDRPKYREAVIRCQLTFPIFFASIPAREKSNHRYTLCPLCQ